MLEHCLGLVDYVAMDAENSPEKYSLLGAEGTSFLRSIELLKSGKVVYEFRTTVVPKIVILQEVTAIGRSLMASGGLCFSR